jgi:hypothetical protein
VAAGCTAYLTKPIKQVVLLQTILEHCPSAFASASSPKTPEITVRRYEPTKDTSLYLQNRRLNVTSILTALDEGDFETVEFLGHGMRGSGGMFGFQEITDIGAALELAAGRADTGGARKCVQELSNYLDHADITPKDPI